MFPGISDGELDRIVAYEIDSLGSIFFSSLPSTLMLLLFRRHFPSLETCSGGFFRNRETPLEKVSFDVSSGFEL